MILAGGHSGGHPELCAEGSQNALSGGLHLHTMDVSSQVHHCSGGRGGGFVDTLPFSSSSVYIFSVFIQEETQVQHEGHCVMPDSKGNPGLSGPDNVGLLSWQQPSSHHR